MLVYWRVGLHGDTSGWSASSHVDGWSKDDDPRLWRLGFKNNQLKQPTRGEGIFCVGKSQGIFLWNWTWKNYTTHIFQMFFFKYEDIADPSDLFSHGPPSLFAKGQTSGKKLRCLKIDHELKMYCSTPISPSCKCMRIKKSAHVSDR